MTGSLVFEEAPFAFQGQSTGTPDPPAKLHGNSKRKVGIPTLHKADNVSHDIEKCCMKESSLCIIINIILCCSIQSIL
jgi:hypothetical protein